MTTQTGAQVVVAHPWGKAAAMRYAIPTEPSRATVHGSRPAERIMCRRALASVPCRCFCARCSPPSSAFPFTNVLASGLTAELTGLDVRQRRYQFYCPSARWCGARYT
ncbi:hypothetical protein IG631_00118 [Alternaria alternata]|nr:hypothetical protein IG631_00118 [Alternaria alternata]